MENRNEKIFRQEFVITKEHLRDDLHIPTSLIVGVKFDTDSQCIKLYIEKRK